MSLGNQLRGSFFPVPNPAPREAVQGRSDCRALVMCLADASVNPRPRRMIELLSDMGFAVDVACFPMRSSLPVRRHFPLQTRSGRNKAEKATRWLARRCQDLIRWSARETYLSRCRLPLAGRRSGNAIEFGQYRFCAVHDLELLPAAVRALGGERVLFDAREFYPEEVGNSWWFRQFMGPVRHSLCERYLPLCRSILTVSAGLAAEYKRRFGVEARVVFSTPHCRQLEPRCTAPETIRMVHMGGANRDRQLENMIEIVRRLDRRFTLDFFLVGSGSYIRRLRRMASNEKRIRFREAVRFEDMIDTLHAYDVGFYYLEPNGPNVLHSLPNKFFEFIQARLALAIGPSPEMASVAAPYRLALVAPEFSLEAMALTLNQATTRTIDACKAGSHKAARELCFEMEMLKLTDVIESLA